MPSGHATAWPGGAARADAPMAAASATLTTAANAMRCPRGTAIPITPSPSPPRPADRSRREGQACGQLPTSNFLSITPAGAAGQSATWRAHRGNPGQEPGRGTHHRRVTVCWAQPLAWPPAMAVTVTIVWPREVGMVTWKLPSAPATAWTTEVALAGEPGWPTAISTVAPGAVFPITDARSLVVTVRGS